VFFAGGIETIDFNGSFCSRFISGSWFRYGREEHPPYSTSSIQSLINIPENILDIL
jgi:hypothetical protein